MPKKPSRKTIVNNLDKVFSEYIRRRYAKNDIVECITCGKKGNYKGGDMHAGHFMSRKHYATRWDEENVQVQCKYCNTYRYGEQYLFAKHLGQDKADELLAKSRTMVKLKDWELQDMIEIYKKKLLELEQ